MTIPSDSFSQSRFHSLDDIRGYGQAYFDDEQAYILHTMEPVRERSALHAGLDYPGALHRSTGDGQQSVWPRDTPPRAMLSTYPSTLHEELLAVNGTRTAEARIQLRLAVVDGYSEAVGNARAGTAPVLLARLVDSEACRRALTVLPEACVSLITDEDTYRRIVARRLAGDPGRFIEVVVDAPAKAFRAGAWLTVPGALPADLEKLRVDLEAAGLTPASAAPLTPGATRTPRATRAPGTPSAPGAPRAPRVPAAEPDASRASGAPDEPDDPDDSGDSGGSDGSGDGPGPRRRRFSVTITVALIGGVCGILAAVLPPLLQNGDDGGGPATSSPPTSATDGPTADPTTSPTATPTTTTGPGRTTVEIADNHNGVPVFANPRGATAAKESIPFNTSVPVSCWTADASGMASVNAFYLIGGGAWKGLYAPANTFANGDPVGEQGGSHDIDPKVPRCAS
ncbi:hypothetical protein [Streptomyces sp. NPDC006739]|uniref:hypothetical protein n=1 Tax=Streptomyces sp. NPDC006739 TaxID=3364763 RepID=UPI0036A74AAE